MQPGLRATAVGSDSLAHCDAITVVSVAKLCVLGTRPYLSRGPLTIQSHRDCRCSAHRVQNARICILCYHSQQSKQLEKAPSAGEAGREYPRIEGLLVKWTNQMYGWQPRYFVLEKASMSCYLGTKDNKGICRASIKLTEAIVRTSRTQPRRFEVYDPVTNTSMLCKAPDEHSRNAWVNAVLRSRAPPVPGGSPAGTAKDGKAAARAYSHSRNSSLVSTSSLKIADFVHHDREGCSSVESMSMPSSPARMQNGRRSSLSGTTPADEVAVSDEVLAAQRQQESAELKFLFRSRLTDARDFLALVKEQTRRLIEYWTVMDAGDDPVVCTAVRKDALLFKSTISGASEAFKDLIDGSAAVEAEQAKRMQELTLALRAAEQRAETAESRLAELQGTRERNARGSFALSPDGEHDGNEVLEGPECELDDDEFFDAVVCLMNRVALANTVLIAFDYV
eukprot:m.63074 g.63074  ORF g.63074 m.63074 type:complete len:451 (+) comp9649_c0_seq2:416-1768(+)